MPDMSVPQRCPAGHGRDDRKTGAIAQDRVKLQDGAHGVASFEFARAILRSTGMKQAGLEGVNFAQKNPEHAAVIFLDGELHRRKRATIARFFTPKAVETRHMPVMVASADALLAEMRANGGACLDEMAWRLAVDVAGEIVGLTIGLTVRKRARLAKRLEGILERTQLALHKGFWRQLLDLRFQARIFAFHYLHVRPAMKARRKTPKDDIITHLVAEKYGALSILMECMTYAGAGMVTTREFITMVAWHLFERDDLRSRYLNGTADEQTAILEEVLRLEPVATLLYRAADSAVAERLPASVAAGARYAIDVRKTNTDEAAAGACPYALDPDRAANIKGGGAFLSFGDGAHRCPGAQVAMTETRIFIDHLFRVPGIKLTAAPRIGWNDALMSYELRGAMVACDPA